MIKKMPVKCPKCKGPFGNEDYLKRHLETCEGKKKKKKRASIPGILRYQVWEKYIGKYLKAKQTHAKAEREIIMKF